MCDSRAQGGVIMKLEQLLIESVHGAWKSTRMKNIKSHWSLLGTLSTEPREALYI